MTHYIGTSALKTLLHTIGVEAFLLKLIAYLKDDFSHWHEFEKSARLAAHSSVGVIELMPISNARLYGFKYVNGHPANTAKGLPTVMAFGALAEVETGLPLLLSEMTVLTALRTAATSALVAQLLAKPNGKTHAIIGCGAQAEFQALAMKAALGLNHVRVFDVDVEAMQKFETNLKGYGLEIIACQSVAEAVFGADVVTTATAAKTRAKILTRAMVETGVHLNAIGGDCPGKTELDEALLQACACIAVEFEPQSRIEGETQQNTALPVVEIAELLASPFKRSDTDITVFDSVGFALEDFSCLRLVYDLVKMDAKNSIDLIPNLSNPKDLFGCLK